MECLVRFRILFRGFAIDLFHLLFSEEAKNISKF